MLTAATRLAAEAGGGAAGGPQAESVVAAGAVSGWVGEDRTGSGRGSSTGTSLRGRAAAAAAVCVGGRQAGRGSGVVCVGGWPGERRGPACVQACGEWTGAAD